jgi:acetyl esterase/lipase
MLAAAGDTPSSSEVGERRKSLEDLAGLAAGDPVAVGAIEDIRTQAGLGLRRYSPSEGAALRTPLVYLHGGGWTAGSLQTHDSVCRTLAAEGLEVFAVDYRLAPEHPFPAGLSDAVEAVEWVTAHAAELGCDASRLVLAGDSAGANLAAGAVVTMHDAGRRPVAGLLLICPILDLAQQRPSRVAYGDGYFISPQAFGADVAHYLGGADPANPRLSPVNADVADWPPSFIHVAEFDPFHDEGVALAERLRAAGVRVELREHAGMIHYFYALPRLIPHAREALAGMARKLRDAVG